MKVNKKTPKTKHSLKQKQVPNECFQIVFLQAFCYDLIIPQKKSSYSLKLTRQIEKNTFSRKDSYCSQKPTPLYETAKTSLTGHPAPRNKYILEMET